MKHTPGPWKLVTKFANEGDVYGDAEIHAPSCYPLFQTEILDEWKRGDAHLIAAAPDMYEALHAALHAVCHAFAVTRESDEAEQGAIRAAYDKCCAAIAKAEGRS